MNISQITKQKLIPSLFQKKKLIPSKNKTNIIYHRAWAQKQATGGKTKNTTGPKRA